MASLWSRFVRFVDHVLGEPPAGPSDVDPAVVEEAIRLIQSHVDSERQIRQIRRLRVNDLSPEHRAQLAVELSRLLRERQEAAEGREPGGDGQPQERAS